MNVSYCTFCKGRRWQMELTLAENLAYLADKPGDLVLVDWQSPDGLREWVLETFEAELRQGKLRYYQLQTEAPFSIPVGKNFAHRLATGDVLFNLDADNFAHGSHPHASGLSASGMLACDIIQKGVYGRIAFTREGFEKVGGYDEGLLPAGEQDVDIRRRATHLGIEVTYLAPERDAILNSKEETIAFADSDRTWGSMTDWNRKRSFANLEAGHYQANTNGFTTALFEDHAGGIHELGTGIWPVRRP